MTWSVFRRDVHENNLLVLKQMRRLQNVVDVDMTILDGFVVVSVEISQLADQNRRMEEKRGSQRGLKQRRKGCVSRVNNLNHLFDVIDFNPLLT